jgi:polar amino acid transport system substrate-binding protein
MIECSAQARAELTPKGKLRVGINFSNFLLTHKHPQTGAPGGVAVDLGRELARRIGAEAEIIGYPSPGELAEAAPTDIWDVGFLGDEPARAKLIDFSPAYVEIEATYLLPPGSAIKSVEEVDRKGVRIIVPEKAAYDLYLVRSLKNAELLHAKGADNAFKQFVADKIDALAGLRPRLITDHKNLPGSILLEGRFTAVQQAAGVPKGRPAAAAYLAAYIEDVKASGLVAQLIEKHQAHGLTVAAKA